MRKYPQIIYIYIYLYIKSYNPEFLNELVVEAYRQSFCYVACFFFMDNFTKFYLDCWPGVLNTGALSEIIKKVTTNPAIPANLFTSIRAVTNLFKNSCFYNWLQKHRSEVGTRFFIVIFWVWSCVPRNGLSLNVVLSTVCSLCAVGGCWCLCLLDVVWIYGINIVADKHLMCSTLYSFYLCFLYFMC